MTGSEHVWRVSIKGYDGYKVIADEEKQMFCKNCYKTPKEAAQSTQGFFVCR